MVTTVIMSLVILAIGGLYYNMQITEVKSQHTDIAVRAARTKIEMLRNSGYESLVPGSSLDFTSELPISLPADRKGTVAVTQPLPELRRVDVTITYTDYKSPQTITLSSNIGIIGLGQGQ